MQNFRTSVLVALSLLIGLSASVSAAPFNKTKHFNGNYILGVCDLAEFDFYYAQSPYFADETGDFTFLPNGTVDFGGVFSGTYVKSNGVITTTLYPTGSNFTVVNYVFYRISGKNYWAEIYFDGVLYGIMRGQLTN